MNDQGYGLCYPQGKITRAHKFYYEKKNGKVPKHLELDHLCRQRACVRPSHQEPVRRRENLLRGLCHCKLTKKQVFRIRRLLSRGVTHKAISKKFKAVTESAIRDIARGRSWQVEKKYLTHRR